MGIVGQIWQGVASRMLPWTRPAAERRLTQCVYTVSNDDQGVHLSLRSPKGLSDRRIAKDLNKVYGNVIDPQLLKNLPRASFSDFLQNLIWKRHSEEVVRESIIWNRSSNMTRAEQKDFLAGKSGFSAGNSQKFANDTALLLGFSKVKTQTF